MKYDCVAVVASLAILVALPTRGLADSFGTSENRFDIEFVEVGASGNSDDVLTREGTHCDEDETTASLPSVLHICILSDSNPLCVRT